MRDEHPGAFEATLIESGLRFRDVGSAEFTWADCAAVIDNMLPRSPLFRALYPDEWYWYEPDFQMLAGIYDEMRVRTATGAQRHGIKSREVPKPLVRPWDKRKETEKLVGDAMPLDDMRKALGW